MRAPAVGGTVVAAVRGAAVLLRVCTLLIPAGCGATPRSEVQRYLARAKGRVAVAVPQPQRVVGAGRGQQPAGAAGHVVDPSGVTGPPAELLRRFDVPQSHRAVVSGGHDLAIAGEVESVDPAAVALEHLRLAGRARRRPDAEGPIPAGRG